MTLTSSYDYSNETIIYILLFVVKHYKCIYERRICFDFINLALKQNTNRGRRRIDSAAHTNYLLDTHTNFHRKKKKFENRLIVKLVSLFSLVVYER